MVLDSSCCWRTTNTPFQAPRNRHPREITNLVPLQQHHNLTVVVLDFVPVQRWAGSQSSHRFDSHFNNAIYHTCGSHSQIAPFVADLLHAKTQEQTKNRRKNIVLIHTHTEISFLPILHNL